MLVFGLAIRAFASGVLPAVGAPVIVPCRIDINRASWAQLLVLPGIGPARADAIVLERIRRGPFESLADLGRVRGLGDERLRGLRPHVVFGARRAGEVGAWSGGLAPLGSGQ